jgi:murein L,D-transpeptidase YcbB/YkuD
MRAKGILVAAVVAVVACAACSADTSQVNASIERLTAAPPDWIDKSAVGKKLWDTEREFYSRRGHAPAWVDGVQPSPRLKDLLQELRGAEAHGLSPDEYGLEEFSRAMESSATRFRGTRFDPEMVPDLDVRLTYAYLTYAADLLGLRHRPREVSRDWVSKPPEDDLVARLTRATSGDSVRETLEELVPAHSQYRGLQVALAAERAAPTGRMQQLLMNLERWRWAPRDLGDRYVLVNVPAYQMQVMENGDPVLAMRVIVGDRENPTPLFDDRMTYIVFSPYWNIPESILREETLPKVARDPGYLERSGIEVIGTSGREPIDPREIDWSDEDETKHLRFRQVPGPENALGRVKFIFPNHFSVYLHDTSSPELFARDDRALSHGCIRVENPVALAQYVLRDQPEWTAERIAEAMQKNEEKTVKLKSSIPVYIGYWTAWVGPDGKSVAYTADPYGLDAAQAKQMARR